MKYLIFLLAFPVLADEVIIIKIQDNVVVMGEQVPAYTQMGVVPIIRINKDYLEECLFHEIKHATEGGYHEVNATCR